MYIHISAKSQRKNGYGGGGEDTAFWALGCLGVLAAHQCSHHNHFSRHAVGTAMLEAQTRVAHRYLRATRDKLLLLHTILNCTTYTSINICTTYTTDCSYYC